MYYICGNARTRLKYLELSILFYVHATQDGHGIRGDSRAFIRLSEKKKKKQLPPAIISRQTTQHDDTTEAQNKKMPGKLNNTKRSTQAFADGHRAHLPPCVKTKIFQPCGKHRDQHGGPKQTSAAAQSSVTHNACPTLSKTKTKTNQYTHTHKKSKKQKQNTLTLSERHSDTAARSLRRYPLSRSSSRLSSIPSSSRTLDRNSSSSLRYLFSVAVSPPPNSSSSSCPRPPAVDGDAAAVEPPPASALTRRTDGKPLAPPLCSLPGV